MGLQEHLRWRKAIPLADTFWGELFGMLTDKFGNHWLLSYHG